MITKFIKEKRKELGLTQEEFAKIINTKQVNISRLESSDKTETKLISVCLDYFKKNGIDLNEISKFNK